MDIVLKLASSSGELNFESVNSSWVRVWLVRNNGERECLGAEAPYYVLSRMLEWLLHSHKSIASQFIEGLSVKWVLSLFENHHVFYGTEDFSHSVLFIQNTNGPNLERIDKIHLTKNEVQQWVQVIQDYIVRNSL